MVAVLAGDTSDQLSWPRLQNTVPTGKLRLNILMWGSLMLAHLHSMCFLLQNSSVETKIIGVVDELVFAVNSQCPMLCGLTRQHFQNTCLMCGTDFNIVFRGELFSTQRSSASELRMYVENWATFAPEFVVENVFLRVSSICPVVIESLRDPVCGGHQPVMVVCNTGSAIAATLAASPSTLVTASSDARTSPVTALITLLPPTPSTPNSTPSMRNSTPNLEATTATHPATTTQLDVVNSTLATPSVHVSAQSTSSPYTTPDSSGVLIGVVIGGAGGAATLLALFVLMVCVCICVWR